MTKRTFLVVITGLLTIITAGVLWWAWSGVSSAPLLGVPSVGEIRTDVPARFSDLFSGSIFPEQERVYEEIHEDVYQIYPCTDAAGEQMVVLLTAQYKPNARGDNTFDTAKLAMTDFESRVYQAWGSLIYGPAHTPVEIAPTFVSVPVTDEEVLTDTLRVADVPNTDQQIVYGWLLNYLVIGATPACVSEVMKTVYHIH